MVAGLTSSAKIAKSQFPPFNRKVEVIGLTEDRLDPHCQIGIADEYLIAWRGFVLNLEQIVENEL
jgi:hypothetical protein